MPTCSFPDAWSTATQFLDYHQTLRYFDDPTQWGAGVAWTPQQMADVEGGPDGVANAHVSDSAQFHVVIPTDPCAGITDQQRYEPTTNPGGVRCTIQDAAINVFGPRPQSLWTPQEKQIGHGFADTPVDNVGVQYGLRDAAAGQDHAGPVRRPQPEGRRPRPRREPHAPTDARQPHGARQRLPQRHDQRDQQPQPHGDHRLPRAQPGALPRRLPGVRGPRPAQPRARQPRQPAHLGGTGRVDRRQPVRAQRLLGPEPLARRRGEGQGQRHVRPKDRPRQAQRT